MAPIPDDLAQFLNEPRDSREYRRALAVKMALQGYMVEFIADILNASPGFVSQVKKAYQTNGVNGLVLKYQGNQPYLSDDERQAVIVWLQAQKEWNVDQLVHHIEETYDVVFQSRQSYYQLLSEAGLSYKKSQNVHPKANPDLVGAKKKEIQNLLKDQATEIERGSVVVLFLDECHLLWKDACGYVWGPKGQRVEISIANIRERQTYYGAINAKTGDIIAIPCDQADGRWTMIFCEFLLQEFQGKRIIICWDGASYHRGEIMQEYLEGVNKGKPRDEWKITCIHFAPYAPEQNPIEHVWLQAKEFVRKNWRRCGTFKQVTDLFEQALRTLSFDFDRLRMYFT